MNDAPRCVHGVIHGQTCRLCRELQDFMTAAQPEPLRPFRCGECGGTVRMASCAGEPFLLLADLEVPIPAGVEVPTCEKCGDTYRSRDDTDRVLLAIAVEAWRDAQALTVGIKSALALAAESVARVEAKLAAAIKEKDDLVRELGRHTSGTQIEGDYVDRLQYAEAELARARREGWTG